MEPFSTGTAQVATPMRRKNVEENERKAAAPLDFRSGIAKECRIVQHWMFAHLDIPRGNGQCPFEVLLGRVSGSIKQQRPEFSSYKTITTITLHFVRVSFP